MATMIDIDEPAIKLDRRVNESWLAAHEFRALQVLARQLPAAVTPDHLTALGVAGAGLVLLGGMSARGRSNGFGCPIWGCSCTGMAIRWMAPWPACAGLNGRAIASTLTR
jgi:hypothetical protein